jgi:hypothetical protein
MILGEKYVKNVTDDVSLRLCRGRLGAPPSHLLPRDTYTLVSGTHPSFLLSQLVH